MTNRRITKEMATWAAEDMKNAVYKEKIEKAKAARQKEADAFIRKCIPAPVLACVKEYKDYFIADCRVRIHAYERKTEDGRYEGSYRHINSETSILLPETYYDYYKILTTREECKKVIEADDALDELYKQSNSFQTQIENALLSLRTEKKITEQLPEALPYIKFPNDKSNLPAPIFSDIRAMLQSVTNNKQ